MGETHNKASEASQVRVLNCYCSSTVIDPIDSIVCIVCVGLCIHASPQRRYRGLLHEKKNQEKGEKETRYPHFLPPKYGVSSIRSPVFRPYFSKRIEQMLN